MREQVQKPENTSRTLDSNPKASKQAPISQILQAYKDRIEGKPVQRQSVDEEELLQAKATQQDHIKAVLQRYSERNIQRYAPEEDEELIQGKFDTVQREEIDEEEILQGKFESDTQTEQKPIHREEKPNNTGLPDNLKTGIENLSGYSMDDVKVHYNSDKPAQLNALAYAQGTDIHVASGQEQHLPHEAWHVVQQKQGCVQPTMQMQGVNINDNEGLEKEADVMGDIVLRMKGNNINVSEKNNTVQTYVKNEIIQGKFWVKKGREYIWHSEDVNENLYIKTGEIKEKRYGKTPLLIISPYIPSEGDYPVYIERILDLYAISTIESSEKAKHAKESGEIKDTGVSLNKTSFIYEKLAHNQKKSFDIYLNQIRPYCNNDGITGIIEGALKNVKMGSILEIENDTAKEVFINRLRLMTEFVIKVGEERIGGEKIKDKYFIESTGSDPHADGQHALFLINRESKDKIVYKPHSLDFEKAFMGEDGFLAYLNTFSECKFKVMDIDPNTHTEEFISRVGHKGTPIEETDFKNYMKQLGMLQVASYVFGITDLHCENIIFGKDGPVAIDAECGGAFHTDTGIDAGMAPVTTSETGLVNSSALYVDNEQRTERGEQYETGKEAMKKLITENREDIINKKCIELLASIDKFRILPFDTGTLAGYLNEYINKGAYDEKLQEVTKRDFVNFFDKHPLFNNNVILEIDEFYIFFYYAIKKGTLPAFEFDLKNNAILLDDNRVGHVKPGIDIKNLMKEQIEKRINSLTQK